MVTKSRILKKLLNYKLRKMKLFKKGFYLLVVLLLSVTTSCTDDDDISSIIGGLDFVIATLNAEGNEVGVVASTVPGDNRIVYTVNFGDANGELEEVVRETSGPMVRYMYPEETATYTITVTAALPGRDDVTITKDHTVIFAVEPPPTGSGGPLEGTWRLAPEAGALGVGPALGDASWFSSSDEDIITRACLFDDTYVFNADGSFQNVLGADTWLEGWQGVAMDECGTPVFPHDGSASATYSYDAGAGTITLDGAGAYLGIPKAVNGSELATPGDAPSSVTYLAEFSADGNTLDLDIEIAGGGYWSFKLVKDVVPTGIQGTWKIAPIAGALAVGPGFNDASWFSSSDEDIITRACLFDDTYVFNADGSFQNVLGEDTWLEGWQGVAMDECGTPVFPHDGSASATYDYNEGAGTITLDGAGAFLGIPKAVNGSELATPGDAPSSITYLAELSDDGNTLEVDIEIAGGGYWSFTFARQ
jgi:type 1 fimbria pilin